MPAWSPLCTLNSDSMQVIQKLNLWSQLIYLLESSIKTLSKRSFSKFFFKFYKMILNNKIKSTYLPKWSLNKLGEDWQSNQNSVKSYLKIITSCRKILKWFNLWFVLLIHQLIWASIKKRNSNKLFVRNTVPHQNPKFSFHLWNKRLFMVIKP